MTRLLSLMYSRQSGEDGSERGLERLLAFTDAVVAIAITLIVLPLVDIAADAKTSPSELFGHEGYRFSAAGVTFLVIASLWRRHHLVFERADRYTGSLLSADLVWLAAVVFLPVPTALLFSHAGGDEEAIAVGAYTATLTVAQLAMAFAEIQIDRHCLREGTHPGPRGAWPAWVAAGITAIASALALAGLGTGALWILALNLPAEWVVLELTRRRRI
jgi:uncharacterized membrane protein